MTYNSRFHWLSINCPQCKKLGAISPMLLTAQCINEDCKQGNIGCPDCGSIIIMRVINGVDYAVCGTGIKCGWREKLNG